MFDKTDIEKYQSITAPPELKNRILSDLEERKETERESNRGGVLLSRLPLRSISALAACLLLAVAIFSMLRINSDFASVSYDGSTVSESRVAVEQTLAMSAKSMSEPAGIPFLIEFKDEGTVSVSHGNLYTVDIHGETVLLGKSTSAQKSKTVWWSDLEGDGAYEMTVSSGKQSEIYVLEFDSSTQKSVIYKK